MRSSAIVASIALLAGCSGSLDGGRSQDLKATRVVDFPLKSHSATPTAGRTLEYFGGPVISNAKVYAVWWGGASGINSAITAAHGGIADFFAGITDSSFLDWLNEYDTNINAQAGTHSGQPGTNQFIGRGNYVGAVPLTGVAVSGTVTDAQIQSALNSAFAAGTLPQPDANTIYAIYFPNSVSISSSGSTSCIQFGAYHEAIVGSSGANAYYLVMPDCGDSFSGTTVVTSHELVEAITDGEPTPGSNPDYPQAWNDASGNEAGDLCQGTSGTVATPLGSFSVQGIWDERSQGCQTFTSDAQDFNVSISPNSATLAAGATGTYTVSTATVAGAAQALALSASAPAGITVSLSAASVTSGSSATLTVVAANPAATSGLQVVVRADPASGRPHTASLLLAISGSTGGGGLTTSITSPAGGATVSGTTPVTATASSGANKIEIYVDGSLLGSSSGSSLSSNWDTTKVADGAHTLTSKAYDAQGGTATSAAVNVTVSNGSGTTQCPPGTVNVGGTCVPSTGCGTSGMGGLAGAGALLLLGAFALARRRAA